MSAVLISDNIADLVIYFMNAFIAAKINKK